MSNTDTKPKSHPLAMVSKKNSFAALVLPITHSFPDAFTKPLHRA